MANDDLDGKDEGVIDFNFCLMMMLEAIMMIMEAIIFHTSNMSASRASKKVNIRAIYHKRKTPV